MSLGKLEQLIMNHIWEHYADTPFTVRDVTATLTRECGTEYAYNTILTVVTHLFQKELLLRRKIGKTCVYRIAVSKNDYVELLSKKVFTDMKKQYGKIAVAHFANLVDSLDSKTLKSARDYIKQHQLAFFLGLASALLFLQTPVLADVRDFFFVDSQETCTATAGQSHEVQSRNLKLQSHETPGRCS